jgi:hypothetical protein
MIGRRGLLGLLAWLPVAGASSRDVLPRSHSNVPMPEVKPTLGSRSFTEEGRAILDAKPGDYYLNTRNDDVFVGVARSDGREGLVWVKLGGVT